MRTEPRELLAVGILGNKSRMRDRIETLLRRGRTFSPRASVAGVAASTVILGGLMFSGSLVPRWIAFAQQTSELRFEVASIKSDVSGEPVMYTRWFPSLHIERMTLKNLVILAYQVQDFEVTGGPGWIHSERYNIDAKTEAPPVPSQQNVALERRGLQTLLRDRFHLTIHRETKQLPIYELTVAKGGLKVHPSNCMQRVTGDTAIAPGKTGSDYCRSPANGGGRIQGSGVSMAFLSHILASRLSRTVVDKTGITGEFDLQLTFTPDAPAVPSPDASRPRPADGAAAADPGPDIFTALQEQLGLKLESAKGPVEILIIDQVEKPDAN
jgi:uncharacterized protein (TIGR03435 family)